MKETLWDGRTTAKQFKNTPEYENDSLTYSVETDVSWWP